MNGDEKVLIMCEIEQKDAIAFLARCESEGMSFSEKIQQVMKIFLTEGDNHLLGAKCKCT